MTDGIDRADTDAALVTRAAVTRRRFVKSRRALEAHLHECRRCREFLESYRATPGIVRRATQLTD